MTRPPPKALADELDDAFKKHLYATGDIAKHDAELALRGMLWDNKSGIIAYLRSPLPTVSREEVASRIGALINKVFRAGHEQGRTTPSSYKYRYDDWTQEVESILSLPTPAAPVQEPVAWRLVERRLMWVREYATPAPAALPPGEPVQSSTEQTVSGLRSPNIEDAAR